MRYMDFGKKSAFPECNFLTDNEWQSLLRYSSQIQSYHAEQLTQYGYSFVMDAFFALKGCEPDKSPMGKAWRKLAEKPVFQSLPPLMVNLSSQATIVTMLTEKILEKINRRHDLQDQTAVTRLLGNFEAELSFENEVTGTIVIADALSNFFDGTTPADNRALVEKFVRKFNPKIFATLLGWARGVVGAETRKIKASTGEFTRFTPGQLSIATNRTDLMRLALHDSETLLRAADDQLTNELYTQEQPAGRGPVVLLIDRSTSMDEKDPSDRNYTRFQTARSLELALATVFNEEGRDLVSILWNNTDDTPNHTYGDPGLEQYLTIGTRGGTIINAGLNKALEVVNEYHHNADIWILTDGHLQAPHHYTMAEYQQEVRANVAEFKANGGRLWATIIEAGHRPDLWGFCDGVINVSTLADTDAMSEILAGIARTEDHSTTGNFVL